MKRKSRIPTTDLSNLEDILDKIDREAEMDKRLLCVKAYYKYENDPDSKIGIATRFFNLPILTQAHNDILEMYIMDMEEMGYTDICLMLMNHDMETIESIGY